MLAKILCFFRKKMNRSFENADSTEVVIVTTSRVNFAVQLLVSGFLLELIELLITGVRMQLS